MKLWVVGRLLRKCTLRKNDDRDNASKKTYKTPYNGRLQHRISCPFLRRYVLKWTLVSIMLDFKPISLDFNVTPCGSELITDR